MLAKRIIPCLDVTAGRVVKGVRFTELRDAGDPVECAKAYDAQGADETSPGLFGLESRCHALSLEEIFVTLCAGTGRDGGAS